MSEDFFATLVAQGVLKPLPTLSFASSGRNHASSSTSAGDPTPTLVQGKDKLLPPVPPISISPRRIIDLLDLLERMDNDIVKEVQRVRESIKETKAEIAEFNSERRAQEKQVQKRRAREEHDTKGIDDEFWLQV